jgi:hypothetical protein
MLAVLASFVQRRLAGWLAGGRLAEPSVAMRVGIPILIAPE